MSRSEFNSVNASPYAGYSLTSEHEKTPDFELTENESLSGLRILSRKFIKNNFIVAGAQQAYINAVVGGSIKIGFESSSERVMKEVNDIYENEITQLIDISDTAEMLVSEMFAAGDLLVNITFDKKQLGKLKTNVEFIDASRIKTRPKDRNNPLVREGVEYTSDGKVKGYWVLNSSDYQSKVIGYQRATDENFKFFPRYKTSGSITRKVCDLIKAPLNLRPDQSRMYPVSTPLLETLNYKNQYLEAVLIGARVSACFAGFISTNNPAKTRKELTQDSEVVNTPGKKLTRMQPGILSYLRPNESITFASPNTPSDNFDAFLLRLSKYAGMVYRIPYEMLFLDLSEINYSSWRGGSLEVARNFARWKRVIERVIQWILITYFQEAYVQDRIHGSLSNLKIKIRFPKFKSVDEEKTARANKIDLANGTTSVQRICDEQGIDFDELQKELDQEMVIKVTRQAEELKLKKEFEKKYDIKFPDTVDDSTEKRDTSGSRREGEDTGEDLDEDDAKERRKTDGNF